MLSTIFTIDFTSRTKTRLLLIGVVLLSLVFSLTRGAVLNGSPAALGIIVLTHLYLPGWLLIRAFNIKTANGIMEMAFALAAGVGVIVSLGAVFRYWVLPVAGYVIVLHILMLLFCLFYPPATSPRIISSRYKPRLIHGLLVLLCAISLKIGFDRSQIRYDLWADETEFLTKINWIVTHPNDHGRYTVQTGLPYERIDVRYYTDGMTFNHAVWVWASGTSAVDLLWHWITPLFIWIVPLAVYGLAYALSENESHGVYSAALYVIISMITIDSFAYNLNTAVGRNAFSNMSTLRYFSTALVLPLSQMVFVHFMRYPSRRLVPILIVSAASLALLHPRQMTILAVTIGAFAVFYTLRNKRRITRWSIAVVFAILVASLLLPLGQRVALDTPVSEGSQNALRPESGKFANLSGLPILGDTFIINPAILVDNPLLLASFVLGVILLLWIRAPESDFAGGSALATAVLLFAPGIAELFTNMVSARIVTTFTLILPLGILWGSALHAIVSRLFPQWRLFERAIPVLLAAAILLLYFEPIPIPASARDQIRAMNEIQGMRDMLDADQALIDNLATVVAAQNQSEVVILGPERSLAYVMEEIPGALTPAGRTWSNDNKGSEGARRFYSLGAEPSFFLDSQDLAYLRTWDVDYVVTLADHSRVFQLRLDQRRFREVAAVDGYLVFAVLATDSSAEYDLFRAMNDQLAADQNPRWQDGHFAVAQAGNPAWHRLRQQWESLPPGAATPSVTYGRAASLYFEGRDAEALPLFRDLLALMPDNLTLIEVTIRLMIAQEQNEVARSILLGAAASHDPGTRAGTAALALSPGVFFVLETEDIDPILQAVDASSRAWQLLAVHQQPDAVRNRSALLASRDLFETADAWLAALPVPETLPHDVITRATWKLALSDTAGALNLLRDALDRDRTASSRFVHPDQWDAPELRGMLHLLLGEQHFAADKPNSALVDFRIAAANGYRVAGMMGLARAYEALDDIQQATAVLDELGAVEDVENASLWAAVARLELAQRNASSSEQAASLAAVNALLDNGQRASVTIETAPRIMGVLSSNMTAHVAVRSAAANDDGTLTTCADFWSPSQSPFPITDWQFTVFDPTAIDALDEKDIPALLVDGAVVRWCTTLAVPDTPSYYPALVIVSASSEPLVNYQPSVKPIALNPQAANPADIDIQLDYTLGGAIHLRGYSLERVPDDQVSVALFWETDTAIAEDYQVLVHFLDDNHNVVAQADSAPLGGIYATSQWVPNMLIQDVHSVEVSASDYAKITGIRVGLYKLDDLQRLPVHPINSLVSDDTIILTLEDR